MTEFTRYSLRSQQRRNRIYNNNGVIDGNPASFGTNGLSNSVETALDNGVLDYALADSDGDTINYVEGDSDDDGCNDVREAGFTDTNNDNYLGNIAPPATNANGLVTGAPNGYTAPGPNYINATPIVIIAEPQDSITCEMQDATFTIQTNAGVTYQWQVSTDGLNFSNINNGTLYSGTTTASLTINDVTDTMEGWKYRVLLNRGGNVCGKESAVVTLDVNPLPSAVTRTLVQCDTGTNPDGITIF